MLSFEELNHLTLVFPDKTAFIDRNKKITWRELFDKVESLRENLESELGVLKNRRAAFIVKNDIASLITLIALQSLGCRLVGLDYSLNDNILRQCLEDLQADLLIVDNLHLKAHELHGFDKITLILLSRKNLDPSLSFTVRTFREKAPPPLSISLTSGSTSSPKAIFRIYSVEARRFAYLTQRFSFTDDDVHLLTLPFHHVSAFGWARLFSLKGATTIISDPFLHPDDWLLAEKHLAKTMLTTPPLLKQAMNFVESNGLSINFKFVIVGGKHFPIADKKKALQLFGASVYEYYGTTETGINTIATPCDLENYPTSSGYPIPGTELLVVDQDNKPLESGEIGRIAIYSYMNMDGYLFHESKNILWKGRKYVLTSDYGCIQGDQLFLSSRSSEYESSTCNLYHIENSIREFPGVADVFCRLLNESLDIYLVANKERHVILTKQVCQLLEPKIKNWHLIHVSQLPYSPSGKVRVSDLVTLQSIPSEGVQL